MAVSLSEINSNRPDGELEKGSPGVVYDISSGLQAVNNAVREQSQNIYNRYSLFQNQLSDFAKNHQLDFADVMNEDIDDIQHDAAKYFSKIKDNPQLITSPNDPDWMLLQSKMAKSKQANSLLQVQNQFRNKYPDLYNDENDALEATYRNTPINERNAAMLNWKLPVNMDAQTLAGTVLKKIGEKFNVSAPYSQPGYFLEVKGTKYPKKIENENGEIIGGYLKVWDDLLLSNLKIDQYGHTVYEGAKAVFDKLPGEIKSTFLKINPENPISEYWKQLGESYYREQDIEDTKLTEDTYDIEKQKLQLQIDKLNKVDIPRTQAYVKSAGSSGTPANNGSNKGNELYGINLELPDGFSIKEGFLLDKEGKPFKGMVKGISADKIHAELFKLMKPYLSDRETNADFFDIEYGNNGEPLRIRVNREKDGLGVGKWINYDGIGNQQLKDNTENIKGEQPVHPKPGAPKSKTINLGNNN